MLMLLAAAAQTATIAVPSPPPPRSPTHLAAPSVVHLEARQHLVDYEGATAQCGGRVVAPLAAVAPFTQVARIGIDPPRAYEMTFTIGDDGRPLGITQRVAASGPRGYVPGTDLAPALSLWRFPASAAGAACTMTFTGRSVPFDRAAPADLYRVAALRMANPSEFQMVMQQIRKSGDCAGAGRPRMLLRAFIDDRRIPQTPGVPSYAVASFDVDADGVPHNPGIVASDGNRVLEAAASDAAGRSRYVGNAPRTRCTIPFVRGAVDPVPAPPMPPKSDYPAGTCPEVIRWARPLTQQFPDAFRRRAIEGWAIVRYDLAPWGATGAVTVLASEPAAEFGEQARRMIIAASAEPAPSGAQGCIARVHYRMTGTDDGGDDAPAF
ncbi:TonB family protein [Sphingomonas sp.]|jgi:TonB family protein|uniref:TonB family protein n=1 Tax=Sphingomonas sp. TaxID=28214 RepID=UPI002E11C705|nr:TonB family protein [Sphingomonas sp.]